MTVPFGVLATWLSREFDRPLHPKGVGRACENCNVDGCCNHVFIATACGVTKRTVVRWARTNEVPDETADRVACWLGVNPVAIWDDWYVPA